MTTEWLLDQVNRVSFVMVDATNTEVAGIGDGNLTVEISKNGGAFGAGGGANTEISDGWYSYLGVVGDADTIGPLSIRVTGAGAVQQNLEYVVQQRTPIAIPFTYTITDITTGFPIEGVQVQITTDITGNNIVWSGSTDTFGVARDVQDLLPFLDPGTYFFFRQRSGFTFVDPDTEVVS